MTETIYALYPVFAASAERRLEKEHEGVVTSWKA
jgi:hypothetical protein